MIAALPMYERPETRPAHDRFWALFCDAYRSSAETPPPALTRDRDLWDIWQSPDLFLAQTCGLPYRTRLHGKVTLLGAPDYGIDETPPGHYRSVLVTSKDRAGTPLADVADALWAVNNGLSQSGWAAPSAHLAGLGLKPIARALETGSHLASAHAVARGQAGIAALDAVTWGLIEQYEPVAAELAVLTWTAPTPGLPMITAPARDAGAIAAALAQAIAHLPEDDRTALGGIRDFVAFAPKDYLSLPPAPPLPKDAAPSA